MADDGLVAFVDARPFLFRIASRIVRSAPEAEDILQDLWLRWQSIDRSKIENPRAFLATATTRLALNFAQSARSRHEKCVEGHSSDPPDTSPDPQGGAERGEALERAVLLLLQNLLPKERAAYVLREAFDYPYPRVGKVLRLSEVNCRQLVARARKHIANERRALVSSLEQRRLLDAFAAASSGDASALEELFASDVGSQSQRERARSTVTLCEATRRRCITLKSRAVGPTGPTPQSAVTE